MEETEAINCHEIGKGKNYSVFTVINTPKIYIDDASIPMPSQKNRG